ncbi:unnamed protein product [Rangifer tarandus platyrhynchus]|uniref:Uncharacterized protein n=2 Tax=Rangifer tarandus platyrhynchus TaxID=3082113 RepID=A0AC59YIT0_RANTA|nr:unnamed protein product [Rangifer tarandus platyrhynchus]
MELDFGDPSQGQQCLQAPDLRLTSCGLYGWEGADLTILRASHTLLVHVCVCLVLSHVHIFGTPCTITHQAPLSMGFPQQEYWAGLPFPSPADLPDSGIELSSPALQVDSLPLSQGKAHKLIAYKQILRPHSRLWLLSLHIILTGLFI